MENTSEETVDLTASSSESQQSEIENSAIIRLRMQEIKDGIVSGEFFHRLKTIGLDGKGIRASCWTIIHEIIDSNNNLIPQYFYCTKCEQIIHNAYKQGTTNKLNRHGCKRKMSNPITKQDKDKLKFAAAKFIADDIRPYSSVEGNGFKSLCFEIMKFGQTHTNATMNDLEAALPCRNTVRDGVKVISDESREFIKAEIRKAIDGGCIAIIIDAWSDDYVHQSYLGMIAVLAYETPDGTIVNKKFTLQVDAMKEYVKSKSVIMAHFYRVLESYGLCRSEVKQNVIVVHDRGGNIRYGMLDESIIQILCYCHLINNLVGKMLQLEEVKKIIDAASELTSYVKNAGLCTHLEKTLKTYCKTRWNSVYIMFDSIIQNYGRIFKVLNEKQIANRSSSSSQKLPLDYISNISISTIEDLCHFLKPFRDMTLNLEGHKNATLHTVWPIYLKIVDLLKPDTFAYEFENGHITEDMKVEGSLYIRSNLRDFEPTDQHKISTISHPLLKSLGKLAEADRVQAYRIIDGLMKEMQPEEMVPNPRTEIHARTFTADFLNEFCEEGKH